MSSFQERFDIATKGEFPYVRFLSVRIKKDRGTVEINAIFDKAYLKEFEQNHTRIQHAVVLLFEGTAQVSIKFSPVSLIASELIKATLEYFSMMSMSVFVLLDKQNIEAGTGSTPFVRITIDSSTATYLQQNGLDTGLERHLSELFFSPIKVYIFETAVDLNEASRIIFEEKHKPEYKYRIEGIGREISPLRREVVCGMPILGNASYICDCIKPAKVILYGIVSNRAERSYEKKDSKIGEKVKGKTRQFLTFLLDDTTARIRCVFFPKEEDENKIKYIVDGNYILAMGSLDFDKYAADGSLQFSVSSFCLCDKTEFEINTLERIVDSEYRYCKPESFLPFDQSSMIVTESRCLITFPAIILELMTAQSYKGSEQSGALIEVAAVKIEDGKISETLSTFIDPCIKLSDEARQAAGVTAFDLAGKPTFEQAIPDLYKFIHGYTVYAHPQEQCQAVLNRYLEKLHFPRVEVVELNTLVSASALRSAKPKQTKRSLAIALAFAKIITNA